MFRFGHLSDIHFRFTNYDTNTLRDKLIEKLKELDRLDAIFITGDIFYRGDNSQPAEEAVKDYIVKIATASRCELSNVFICAGNHDLKRYKGRANTLKCIIDDYKETNGNLNTTDYNSLVYTDVCVPFNQICERITGMPNPEKIHRFVPMREVNLIMLNTAVFAGQTYPGQKNAEGKLEDTNLFICDEKFRELKSDVKAFIDENKLTICLGHHSTDCFESKERDRLIDFLESIHCDLYLCGHIHAIATNLIEHTEATYRLSCGGPFKDDDNFNTPSFEVGEYDPVKHDLTLMLFNYYHSWELCNQARRPWRGGIWKRNIRRLENAPVPIEREAVDGNGAIEVVKKRYYDYLLSQSSEINLDGMPIFSDDIKRAYKLNQIFIPEHFDHAEWRNSTIRLNGYDICDLMPSERPIKNVILADPGYGKTTLLKWLAFTCCTLGMGQSREEKYIQSRGFFPVLIRCRDVDRNKPTIWGSILDTVRLAEWLPSSNSSKAFAQLVKKQLEDGSALMLIDGLDEIDDEQKRKDFTAQLAVFINENPKANIIVTSRSKGYNIENDSAFSDFSMWRIRQLSSDDVNSLCQKWYALVYGNSETLRDKAKKLANRINKNGRLSKLANNPLMLTTLLLVERRLGNLPNKRAGLYHDAVGVLLESWNAGVHEKVDLAEAKYQLAYVAFHMMTDPKRGKTSRTQITRTELQNALQAVRCNFGRLVYNREPISKFLQIIEQRSAILFKSGIALAEDGHSEPLYSFQHLTFEEYLAAYAVAEGCYSGVTSENRDGRVLFKYLLDAEMGETISLAAAIKSDCACNLAEEIICRLKNETNTRTDIKTLRRLLLQIIADEVSINRETVMQAFEVLFEREINSSDQTLCAQILIGKFGRDLIDYFRKVDDYEHNGIEEWSPILVFLADEAINPVTYYLQYCKDSNNIQIANSLHILACGAWVRGKIIFSGLAPNIIESLRNDVKSGLTSNNTEVLRAALTAIDFCIPGLWNSLDNIAEYFSAFALLVNQTNRVPNILSYKHYSPEFTFGMRISPMTNLITDSVEAIISYTRVVK